MSRFTVFSRSVVRLAALALAFGALLVSACADVPKEPAQKPDAAEQKGDEVFGYSAAFDEEIRKIGQITPQEFARRYGSKASYLPRISWDPMTAQFYDMVNRDPQEERAKNPQGGHFDFRLNADELARFKENGFVVSERLGSYSFGEVYGRNLPVYITADSILHAWHRSYVSMLEDLETNYLAPTLDEILTAMAARVPEAHKQYGGGVLAESLKDADYFLAVARSLLAGQQAPTHLGQEERVAKTLRACQEQQLQRFDLFGREERIVDFSQFKVRGRYEFGPPAARQYFQAMMWCGRIDRRVGGPLGPPRELGGALVLLDLLERSGKFEQWQRFDQLLQTVVGRTDSMTFAQLRGVLAKGNVKSAADVKTLDTLAAVQKNILAGTIGLQHIRGDHYYSFPFGPEKAELPRSFTFLGQKFVVDSWVTSKVVFDDIIWDNKVQRRIPSCLDVAFAARGNDQVVPA
jgi:hypothetical protein